MGSWWGSTQLAYKFATILGAAIAMTFFAGVIKLYMTRRRVAKAQKKMDLEATGKTEEVPINQRQLDEGDLFGVRAIESGYFGGVSQSQPSSAANSPQIGPTSKGLESPSLISINSESNSASNSKSDPLLSSLPASKSTASLTANKPPQQAMPTRKVLRPSEAELNGRINHAAVDVDMNVEMPPSPIAYKTLDLPIPPRHPGRTWSMHSGSLNLIPGSSQDGLSLDDVPPKMSATSLKHLSNSNSIEVEVGSPTTSVFPPTRPKKAAQRQSRGAFTGNLEKDASYLMARQGDVLAVPAEDRYKKDMTVELSHLSGISQWGEKVMADLAAQTSQTSSPKISPISQFIEPEQLEQFKLNERVPEQPKMIEKPKVEEPTRSASEPNNTTKKSHSGSSIISSMAQKVKKNVSSQEKHARSFSGDSGKSIKRTHDSLRNARKKSREELSQQKRRSLDRDQVHYDPRPAARTRTGSVVGRTVDFDRPRASPFATYPSVALAITTPNHKSKSKPAPAPAPAPYSKPYNTMPPSHAYQSSVSSYEDSDRDVSPSHSAKSSASSFSIPVSRFSTTPKEPKQATIPMTPIPIINYSPTRPRSVSNISPASITDVYESYYRKSVITQRASIASELDSMPHGDGRVKGNGLTARSKKPANLTLLPNTTSVYGGVETIVEVETPMASPVPSSDRYSEMV